MELPTSVPPPSNIGIRKYNGHWRDYVDRELNSMDHLIENSFAEFRKEIKGSGPWKTPPRVRRASGDYGLLVGSLTRSPAKKVSVPNVSTLPRRFSQKAVPQEPLKSASINQEELPASMTESTYVPPCIKELESLYAPMKNLNQPLLSGRGDYKPREGDMPKPHPLPFKEENDDSIFDPNEDDMETVCSVIGDIPPNPPPVQSHAVLQESLGHEIPFAKSPIGQSRKITDWGKIGPPLPPKRTNSKLSLRKPGYLNLSRESTPNRSIYSKPNHHRTSLMSTGSSESSGSVSLPSSCDNTRVVTPTTNKDDFFFNGVMSASSPLREYETIHHRHSSSASGRTDTTNEIGKISADHEEEEYIKMHPVFTSRETFNKQTHYINLLVSGGSMMEQPSQQLSIRSGSEEIVSHVYEEPEKCKTDSALRRRKKRVKALSEYRELMAEVEYKRLYRIGLNLFNEIPALGIDYLVAQNFLELSPSSVAKFLHDCSGLSKNKVGEYVTELDSPFSMKVLSCFMDLFDFGKVRIDKALRKLLELAHAPGDAARIRKILETFSKKYIKCNPKFCSDHPSPVNAVISLSYTVLLLITDNFDIRKKKKMSLSEFSEKLTGSVKDQKLIKSVYKGVKKEEFRDGGDHYYQTVILQERIMDPATRKPVQIATHQRRLVCICQMHEVMDIMAKKESEFGSKLRSIFLFNDLLLVGKQTSKFGKKTSLTYKDSFPLVGLELSLFHTPVYGYGVQICKKGEVDKVLLTLNAASEIDRYKFVMDLQESILETNQTEEAKRRMMI